MSQRTGKQNRNTKLSKDKAVKRPRSTRTGTSVQEKNKDYEWYGVAKNKAMTYGACTIFP